jgi:hypothetical protein
MKRLFTSIFLLAAFLQAGAQATVTAAFTYAPNDTVCQDSCITFTNTSLGTVDSIEWIVFPGMAAPPFPTVDPFTLCFTAWGTYPVALVAFGGGGSDTATAVIAVKPSPHPVVTKSGHVLTVSGASYTSYQWYDNTTAIAGATNNNYTYTGSGVFSVKVESDGCSGTSNVISTLGVGQLNSADNSYWIAQSNTSSITLRSAGPTDEPLDILLADATGRVIRRDTWSIGDNISRIENLNLAPGLYIIRLYSNSGIISLKMVSQ